jgi:uncharacterized protein DUF1801
MAANKTQKTSVRVEDFLNGIENEKKKKDAYIIHKMMQEVSGQEAKIWGTGIVGYGVYHYKYASGREGDWFLVGFSPRKQNLTLYLMCDVQKVARLYAKLGKYKTGKSCLYINKLEDVNLDVLKELTKKTIDQLQSKYKD